MPKTKKGLPPTLTFEGAFAPGTADEQSRTVQVKWYTGARVERYSWSEGRYMLELSMDPKHVDMKRLSSGTAPLLNAHNSWTLSDVIGVIENAEIKDGVGFANVRFSKRPDADLVFQDVKDGIIRNVSVGASISAIELLEDKEGSPKVYRATKWEPYELSFVPAGADPDAQSFGRENGEEDPLQELIKGGHTMAAEENKDQTVQSTAPAPVVQTAPAATAELTEQQKEELRQAERTRVSEILAICGKHKMTEEFKKKCVDSGASLDKVREQILNKLAEAAPTVTSVHVGEEQTDKRREAFQKALLNRADPAKYKADDNLAHFRGRSLVEMARQYMSDCGEKVDGLSPREVAELAVCGRTKMGGMMTSSDMPLILGNTIDRRLAADYQELAPTWPQFCTRATAPDFKEMTVVSLSGAMTFKDVPEHGEYRHAKLGERGEKYAVSKSGVLIALTWEMMINDDLGAFNRIPRRIASGAREKEASTIYGILNGNPKMSDNKAIFHADHGNLATTAGIPDVNTLAAAVQAMFAQVDDDGKPIVVKPTYLIHGGSNLVNVKKLLWMDMSPSTVGDINIFKGEFTPVLDTHITDKKWFLVTDPSFCDTIEYAYLDGEEGIFTEQRNGFEIDGLEIKARMVFGAKALDYRGMYKNAGE